MTMIDFSYSELVKNIIKRLLLLAGKLAGYKGFAVLVATVLLRSGYVGEAAWASVIISALCGVIVPKAAANLGNSIPNLEAKYKGEKKDEKNAKCNQPAYHTVAKPSDSGRRALESGKRKIREALQRAKSESEDE